MAGQNSGFQVGDESRSFFVIPPAEGTPRPAPLLIAFHGTTETGHDFIERAQLEDFADRGFLVIAPDSAGHGTIWPVWDALRTSTDHDRPSPDLAFFDALVPCAAAHFEVDRNRIYIAGHSAGGMMTNFVLYNRSELLAGAIVGSGVFSNAQWPSREEPISPLLAIVTWGGPEDEWSGAAGSVTERGFNFEAEASLASQFYARTPGLGHVQCSWPVGHAWLRPLNDYFADLMLAHPKGSMDLARLQLVEPPPARPPFACATEPFVYESEHQVTCPPSRSEDCRTSCQWTADCLVENSTISTVLSGALGQLGFVERDLSDCSPCIEQCETRASSTVDADVLACIAEHANANQCSSGITGARPFSVSLEECCADRSDSSYCVYVCESLLSVSSARAYFPYCEPLVSASD